MIKIEEYQGKYVIEISDIIIKKLTAVNVKNYTDKEIDKMRKDFTIEKLKKFYLRD